MRSLKMFGFQVAGMLVVLGLASCAGEKKISGMEQVQANRAKLDETRDRLKKASSELERMQSRLSDLLNTFAKSDDIPTRERAKTTLDRLLLKVQESELDFRDLAAENRSVANDLDRRLRSVAESNLEMMRTDRKAEADLDKKTTNQ